MGRTLTEIAEQLKHVDKKVQILYCSAFTEDLFYWDNDLENDTERKLKIHPNAYTRWALQEQGQDQNAIAQR